MYKVILYTDNTVGTIQVPNSYENEIRSYSVYSHLDYENDICGIYAIRDTKEEAMKALLEHFSEQIDSHKEEIAKLNASKKALSEYFRPLRCWECKHWGSTTMYGVSRQEGHVIAVSNLQNAHCPFHLKKNGRPRCMSRYGKRCEHFEGVDSK